MLERLRFQEIKSVIFKAPEDIVINRKQFKKGQPVLIIDEPSLSGFKISDFQKTATGRGYETSTGVINSVDFSIVDGYVLYNLWNMVYGTVDRNKDTVVSRKVFIDLNYDDTIEFEEDINNVFVYMVDDHNIANGVLRSDQYTIENNTIKLIGPFTGTLCIVYETPVKAKEICNANQLGENLVLDLDVLAEALDPISGEHMDIVMRFPSVNVTTDLGIKFNSNDTISYSRIDCKILPEKSKRGINKDLFQIIVL